LYTYPCFTITQCTWTTVIQARQAYPSVPLLAVINPNSGPGRFKDTNYVQGIKNLQDAGVVVLGYVWTGYGRVPLSKVENQVSSYKNWYAVNGIFFDGMAYVTGSEKYYSTLNSYVKSLGMTYNMNTTTVASNRASVTAGTPITITATVTDTSSSPPSSPSGTVSWSDNGAGGSFLTGTCTVSPTSSSQSQCTITYVAPFTPGSKTITASYSGDSTHLSSSGTSSLTVVM